MTRPPGYPDGRAFCDLDAATRAANSGSSAHGSRRIFCVESFCARAARSAVSKLGARITWARRNAERRSIPSGSHTSTPCMQRIDRRRGRMTFMPCATGARFACAARTTRAPRHAAPAAAAANFNLDRPKPRNEISSPAALTVREPGGSLRLRNSHLRLRSRANAFITAAICRPASWMPPGASSSGNRPTITRTQFGKRTCRRQVASNSPRLVIILSLEYY